jgi:hypothetical protein
VAEAAVWECPVLQCEMTVAKTCSVWLIPLLIKEERQMVDDGSTACKHSSLMRNRQLTTWW